MPGPQLAGQLAQGPWKSKLSQRHIDRSWSPISPVGGLGVAVTEYSCPGRLLVLAWGQAGAQGERRREGGKKEPSQLSSWVSPGATPKQLS